MHSFHQRFWHGVAYYPELWRDQIDTDLALMQDVGINLVRIGEFAWSAMEPREGEYDWAWLDETMDKCHRAGIALILCTPTPTPPRWMSLKYPDILRIDRDGQPFRHGSRQHVSHCSPTYRAFSQQITAALAERYGKHPALVAWQTDNEFLCHVHADFHPQAVADFRTWLQGKYPTIDTLNQAWSTQIWSEDYPSFASIDPPAKTPFHNQVGTASGQHHISLASFWAEFTSWTVVRFQREQLDLLRKYSTAPITHNQCSLDRVPSQDLFADLDFASYDVYTDHNNFWIVGWVLDLLRGAKMTKPGTYVPYFIMETSPSHNGATNPGHKSHPAEFLPVEAALSLALGGNGFCYWLWRQQRSGVETCHGAVVTSWGTPSVGYKSVQQTSALIKKMENLLGELPAAPAEIAWIESRLARFHIPNETMTRDLNMWKASVEIHKAMLQQGFWRDMRFEDADLSGYKVVLSPYMPIITPEFLAAMEKNMQQGATWIVGPLSGLRTAQHTVPTDAGMGALDALGGFKTLWPTGLDQQPAELHGQPITLSGYGLGLEAVHPECEVLGRYCGGHTGNAAWAVQRKIGQGRLVVLAAAPEEEYGSVISTLLQNTPIQRYRSSWGTMIIPRAYGKRRAYVIGNLDGLGGTAELPEEGTDILTGQTFTAGTVQVPPFGVLVITND